MLWTLILLPIVCAALYLLYRNGYMVTQAKRAVKYIESGKGRKASFSHCTGFTRRRMNFDEDKSYHFAFSQSLTAGEVTVELLDANKEEILLLDEITPNAAIELSRKGKYFLVFRFNSASGNYTLSWQ